MDKEQDEFQFLGFFGIFKESLKIISTYRKIFIQITISIIFPLSFIFLAHIEIFEFLFGNILLKEHALDQTQVDAPKYCNLSLVISKWTAFWLFKITYFIILSLLSTSAVVYTIACIYTSKEITFKKVMTMVPKIWKRLMVTFTWNFNIISLLVLIILWEVLIKQRIIEHAIFIVLSIIYLMGFVYTNMVWHLASVVSILEDVYGIQAMMKSKILIKGKMGISIGIFLLLNLSFIAIQLGFERYVVVGESPGSVVYGIFCFLYFIILILFGLLVPMVIYIVVSQLGFECYLMAGEPLGSRIGYGILCFLTLSILILFGLVIQTVLYFVCKSYHHENIHKSSLVDHLDEIYLGEYVSLESNKDVQVEQFYY